VLHRSVSGDQAASTRARDSAIFYRSQSNIDRFITISITFPRFSQFVLIPSVLIGRCPLSRGRRIWRRRRWRREGEYCGVGGLEGEYSRPCCVAFLTFPFYAGRGPSVKTRKHRFHRVHRGSSPRFDSSRGVGGSEGKDRVAFCHPARGWSRAA